jgi:hypothetical protein
MKQILLMTLILFFMCGSLEAADFSGTVGKDATAVQCPPTEIADRCFVIRNGKLCFCYDYPTYQSCECNYIDKKAIDSLQIERPDYPLTGTGPTAW